MQNKHNLQIAQRNAVAQGVTAIICIVLEIISIFRGGRGK
jgi:hypothetical protein